MNILLTGRGVIGTVYATDIARDSDQLLVLRHRPADTLPNSQLTTQEKGQPAKNTTITVVDNVAQANLDLVLIAVCSDQLASTFPSLKDSIMLSCYF